MEIAAIQNKVYEIRGRKVMLDFDLAQMYRVETKRLKEQVRRNIERFPDDFMFELTKKEFDELVAICDHNLKYSYIAPLAFTQEGAAMLSGVLRSPIAIQVNIIIMRAFVAVRDFLLASVSESNDYEQLRGRVLKLEQGLENNLEAVNDLSEDLQKELDNIYNAIGALSLRLPQLNKPRPHIGFKQGYQ